MVNFFLKEYDVGVYEPMFLFGVIVSIPSKHLRNASVSKISEFVAKNDLKELGILYKRLGTNMLLIGGGLFLGILVNMAFIYSLLPSDYGNTYYVVLFIGIAQLIDMITSVNFEIIASSKLYRYNTYIVVFSILIAILFNIVFIPLYGIEGAAIGLAGIQPDLLYLAGQALVFFSAIGGPATHPAVISASAYIEYLGHSRNGK
jgi:O-antigen/teichoic acid export membrane protein